MLYLPKIHFNKGEVMTILIIKDVGASYLKKIQAIEDYLTGLPINFISTIFRSPANGTAYCLISLGSPRQISHKRFCLWKFDSKLPSQCTAHVRLDMYPDSTCNEGNVYNSTKNADAVLPIIRKISELFRTHINVQLYERQMEFDLSDEKPLWIDRVFQHHSSLDTFA